MNPIKQLLLASIAILWVLVATGRCGDEKPLRFPETPCESQFRAGCPQIVSHLARPSDTPNYRGYYVGGGAALGGQPRSASEGTWGWDYLGVFPKWVALDWWHSAHKQGGSGAYATDHK